MSPPEFALWNMLRGHRLGDVKFTRQVECGPFYIDFAARMARLAIELDGDTHADRERYDAARTNYLQEQAWRVIRFTNGEVMSNPEGVGIAILAALGKEF